MVPVQPGGDLFRKRLCTFGIAVRSCTSIVTALISAVNFREPSQVGASKMVSIRAALIQTVGECGPDFGNRGQKSVKRSRSSRFKRIRGPYHEANTSFRTLTRKGLCTPVSSKNSTWDIRRGGRPILKVHKKRIRKEIC